MDWLTSEKYQVRLPQGRVRIAAKSRIAQKDAPALVCVQTIPNSMVQARSEIFLVLGVFLSVILMSHFVTSSSQKLDRSVPIDLHWSVVLRDHGMVSEV
jgi:hypothetical protein